jgi:hypothetical protein
MVDEHGVTVERSKLPTVTLNPSEMALKRIF